MIRTYDARRTSPAQARCVPGSRRLRNMFSIQVPRQATTKATVYNTTRASNNARIACRARVRAFVVGLKLHRMRGDAQGCRYVAIHFVRC